MAQNETSFPGGNTFQSTRWTVVLRAKGSAAPEAIDEDIRRDALGQLIEMYWKPLYFFVRKKGRNVDEAKDLTQAFFATFLEKDFLRLVGREKGRFRTFLLVAFEHFLFNEYEKATTQKRGGGRKILSFDFADAEERYLHEPFDNVTPERLFMRKWVLELTGQAMATLKSEFRENGKEELFKSIGPLLTGGEDFETLAKGLNMTSSNLKVTVHRARKRYGELIRLAVKDTVQSDGDVDAELYELMGSL